MECKAEKCLLKPDVTDKTHNTVTNFIPSQNIMKILSTAPLFRPLVMKLPIMLEKKEYWNTE